MRQWILMLFAFSFFVVATAPASQATPLLPVGPLATADVANDAVLVHHRWWHVKRGKAKGWGRGKGKHKGWR